jgi:hypothetical protein
MGEAKRMPQNDSASEAGGGSQAAAVARPLAGDSIAAFMRELSLKIGHLAGRPRA